MLKNERILAVKQLVDRQGTATVNEIAEKLQVSTMTVRRDLEELANQQELIRVHGGAQSKQATRELSRSEKTELHIGEKREVAQAIASLIADGETIFLGPGTTNELVSNYIDNRNLRIVTNSLPVFNSFLDHVPRFDLCLVGGTYRNRSGAFIGSMTNEFLNKLRMNKAFVGVNGINEHSLMNANPEEGQTQRIALANATQKFAIADHYKLNRDDFYSFYHLGEIDGLVTDAHLGTDLFDQFNSLTKVLTINNI